MKSSPGDESSPLLSDSAAAATAAVTDYSSFDVKAAPAAAAGGSRLSYQDLSYTAPVGGWPWSRRQLRVLHRLHGSLDGGMNAIMGPTGSGKTTLLDALAGRKDPRRLGGRVLVDGRPQAPDFKCRTGYVAQDDQLAPTLSVRENLAFSAALRLPPTVRADERRRRVDELLEQLGLRLVADTRVGSALLRGVSGGERKRTSIGMEVIFQPALLFLDEPTTGLDASTAFSVMQLLQTLSRSGKTIVFSIHQPRYSIFRTFDTLTILSRGQTVFQGRAADSLQYFEQLGYRCEQFNNPLDLFLDVVNGDAERLDGAGPRTKEAAHEELVAAFENSEAGRLALAAAQQSLPLTTVATPSAMSATYANWAPRQLAVVAGRQVRQALRNPQSSAAQLGTSLLFALLVGTIYLQLPADLVSGVQNRVGAFFFATMTMVFNNMGAVELFLQERALFAHENMSGYYRVSVYFLAKVFCDLLPLRVAPLLLFCPISYFMIGLDPQVDKFLFYALNLLLVSFASTGLAFFISSSVSIFAVASLLLAMTSVFMLLFGGLLVNLSTMGDWLRWLRYASTFRYSVSALCINELKDMEFCSANGPNGSSRCQLAGNKYLEDQGIPYGTQFDLWVNEIALAAFAVVFLFLSYVQLRRLYKYR